MNPMLPAALQRELVLASGSPRRATILRMLGFDFEIEPTDVAEEELGHADPQTHVTRLALHKAEAAAARRGRGVCVGADTVVVVDGEILEKPASPDAALAMLQRLRDRWHVVHTGVAVLNAASRRRAVDCERTDVRFHAWDDAFLGRYVATGECLDKAGAYAIQGLGALLVREIRGCYYNVMGLPIGCFVRLLAELQAREEAPGAG